jgi:hypothetical protein
MKERYNLKSEFCVRSWKDNKKTKVRKSTLDMCWTYTLENFKNQVLLVHMQFLFGYFMKIENNNIMITETILVSEITVINVKSGQSHIPKICNQHLCLVYLWM